VAERVTNRQARSILSLVLLGLWLCGCATQPSGAPAVLFLRNESSSPVIVRITGTAVTPAGYRIDAGQVGVLTVKDVSPTVDPSVTVEVLSSGCEEMGRALVALTKSVIVTVDAGAPPSIHTESGDLPSASPVGPLDAAEACPSLP